MGVAKKIKRGTEKVLVGTRLTGLPVFGTEEALVEPMLLALDTRLLFNADSVKNPASDENIREKSY